MAAQHFIRQKRITPPISCSVLAVSFLLSFLPPAHAEEPPVITPVITLEQAFTLADRQNESLAVLRARVEQAEAARTRALSLFLPLISVGGAVTFSDVSSTVDSQVVVPSTDEEVRAQLRMSLINPPAIPQYMNARRGVEVARLDAGFGRTDIFLRVAQAYYGILAADDRIEITRRSLATREAYLNQSQALLRAGEAIRLDVQRAQLQVLSAQRDLANAAAARSAAADVLSVLMARPLGQNFTVVPPEPPKEVEQARNEEILMQLAGSRREDLRSSIQRVEIAESERFGNWLQFLPGLSMTGSYRVGKETVLNPQGNAGSLTLSLDWILFSGLDRYGALGESKARLKQAGFDLRLLERQVSQQVRTGLRNMSTAEKNVQTATEEVAVARETYQLVKLRYEAGLATSLDVTTADEAVLTAEVGLNRENFQLNLARMELLWATGVLGSEVGTKQ